MSAGCERLPGSKGKGENSRPGPPRPLAAFDPHSLDCLGLSAKAWWTHSFIPTLPPAPGELLALPARMHRWNTRSSSPLLFADSKWFGLEEKTASPGGGQWRV